MTKNTSTPTKARPAEPGMEGDDGEHGDGPQAVDFRTIEIPHAPIIRWSAGRSCTTL